MEVRSAAVLLLLLALQAAAQEDKYFEIGGTLTLNPMSSGEITSITWKHKGNVVAEYIKDSVPLEYLSDLKGRTNVDLTTGVLTVKDMRKSDDGKFTVEINNRVLPVSFNAVGIKPLPEPAVVLKNPTTCYKNSDSCNLTCNGDVRDSGPVQYFWKLREDGAWKESGQDWMLTKIQMSSVEKIICKIQNPISEKESGPLHILVFPPLCSFISDVLGVLMRSVALLVLFGLVVWFFWQNRMCRCRTREDNQA
ncbi:T-lymphocyte surface antigen Ly-9-like [Poecilia formosa]|uniref:T-lymphocyte surface antigen Ly-9-like n=1 Tax=Poecilia formosa TaxID=48698 RepID=UPI0007B8E9EB|nr:PREDICTED: T-lymphocyte surface antigen Ly-9-like [Poecilia formosa]